MRTILSTTVLLLMALALCPAPARADKQTQKWWAEEQKCIAKCPKMPRFGGSETAEQFQERIKKTDKYNHCRRKCIIDYMEKVRVRPDPFDDGTEGYFKRNGGLPE